MPSTVCARLLRIDAESPNVLLFFLSSFCYIPEPHSLIHFSPAEVLEKLRPLTDQIKELTEQFLKEVKAKKCVTAPEVQDPFAKLIKAMREALDLFQSNTLTRKTSFAFDHERVLESLTALENAIQARSAAEVTGYARAVIDQITELKNVAESSAR